MQEQKKRKSKVKRRTSEIIKKMAKEKNKKNQDKGT